MKCTKGRLESSKKSGRHAPICPNTKPRTGGDVAGNVGNLLYGGVPCPLLHYDILTLVDPWFVHIGVPVIEYNVPITLSYNNLIKQADTRHGREE